jgi:hypothetical protein
MERGQKEIGRRGKNMGRGRWNLKDNCFDFFLYYIGFNCYY